MKFEYETADEATRECVAYIDADGDLMIKNEEGSVVWISQCVGVYGSHSHWCPSGAVHRFYPGDSITITF